MTNPSEFSHDRPQDDLPLPYRTAVDAILAEPVPDIDLEHLISCQPMPATFFSNPRRPKPTFLKTINDMPWIFKSVTAVGLAAALLVLCLVFSSPAGSSIALAQVIDKIVSAKTLSCEIIAKPAGNNAFSATGKILLDSANNVRDDMHVKFQKDEDDLTLILNMNAGKSVMWIQKQKVAVVDFIKVGDQNFLKETVFDRLRALSKASTRSLGKKQIDGVECEGFEITKGTTVRFWANAKTGDPLRLEMDGFPCPQPIGRINLVVNNFKIDEKFDPSLFKVEPPEGFTVVKSPISVDLTAKPANDLVMMLRVYAKQSGGRFPDRLLDPDDPIFKILDTTSDDPNEKPTPENMELALLQGAVLPHLRMYLMAHKQGTDYQYYPGITLGEKARIVFWSRNTKTGEYTAAFGDFRVEKIDKEKLPPPVPDGKE